VHLEVLARKNRLLLFLLLFNFLFFNLPLQLINRELLLLVVVFYFCALFALEEVTSKLEAEALSLIGAFFNLAVF